MSITVNLPWPARPLWQNWRGHWGRKSSATKDARHAARIISMGEGVHKMAVPARPVLRWAFHPPDRRKREISNLIGAVKAHQDGIQDALGVDDALFLNHYPTEFAETVKGGAVVVTIEGKE